MCVLDIDLLELAITTWKGSNTGKLVKKQYTHLPSNTHLTVTHREIKPRDGIFNQMNN